MRKHEALTRLGAIAPDIRRLGATELYLFGSTARDEAREDSDIDLFIDYDPDGRFSALDLIAARRIIETTLGRSVDLTTRDGLHPLIRHRVEHEAERVF